MEKGDAPMSAPRDRPRRGWTFTFDGYIANVAFSTRAAAIEAAREEFSFDSPPTTRSWRYWRLQGVRVIPVLMVPLDRDGSELDVRKALEFSARLIRQRLGEAP